jgi:mannose-6-phosphate isomerase
VDLLQCPIQRYAWGSTSAIPALLGVAEDGGPQAELWAGAHPAAPSTIDGRSLAYVIADDPTAALGAGVVERLGPRLPFLAKVLSAAAPLSLQAHPDRERAAAGFAEDEAAGIALDAPERRYKDDNHKPEILVALTPFTALAGFRSIDQTVALLEALGLGDLSPFDRLTAEGSAAVVATLLGDRSKGEAAATRVAGAAHLFAPGTTSGHGDAPTAGVGDPSPSDVHPDEATAGGGHDPTAAARRGVLDPTVVARWMARIADEHPGDPGVAVALLLNLVELAPGQAVHLGAGNLHAYLEGTGIEVMAASDNVLRGGLTPKHVDVDELLVVLDGTPGPPPVVTPISDDGLTWWPTFDPDFAVSAVGPATSPVMLGPGPRILIVVEGPVVLATMDASLEARKGSVVWVPASDGAVWVGGPGRAFVATVGPA